MAVTATRRQRPAVKGQGQARQRRSGANHHALPRRWNIRIDGQHRAIRRPAALARQHQSAAAHGNGSSLIGAYAIGRPARAQRG
jgi:hypothetical protein